MTAEEKKKKPGNFLKAPKSKKGKKGGERHPSPWGNQLADKRGKSSSEGQGRGGRAPFGFRRKKKGRGRQPKKSHQEKTHHRGKDPPFS